MSTFLSTFMRAARTILDAERSMAFDKDMNLQDRLNIDDAELQDDSFADLVLASVGQAIEQGEAVISNNMITDASDAPQTNIHLHDLRIMVAIPVLGYGAVYLDQRIRKGVFKREVVDKITQLASKISQSGDTSLSEDDVTALYDKL
jgi:hypothetical protein